jgi:acyl dehydratase
MGGKMPSDTPLQELEAKIGQELGVSDWIPMTQAKFDGFAEITGDRDWLHNDPERCARESPYGKTIAQGHLLLAHLSQVGEALMPDPGDRVAYALNYGYDRVRVIRPVLVGSRIRGRLVLKEIRSRAEGQYVVKSDAMIEVEGSDGPHLVAEWLFFVQMA